MKLNLLAAAFTAVLLTGCATQQANQIPPNTVQLTIMSEPAGAFISEKGTTTRGMAPLVLTYSASGLSKDNNGCSVVKGFEARWGSGASASTTNTLRFCGGGNKFHYVLNRNPADPNLDKDLQIAMQLTQQQQAAAAQAQAERDRRTDAMIEGLAAGFAGAMDARAARQPVQIAPMTCTSKRTISGSVVTDCN